MVEAAQLQVHIKNGAVDWANGKIYPDISISVHPGITPDVAIQHALKITSLFNTGGKTSKNLSFKGIA